MTAVARHTDPETSKAAAASVTEEHITGLQARILNLYREMGPLTDAWLIADLWAFGYTESSIRTRRSELVRMGKVVDTGGRWKTASGRQAIVWGLAEEVLPNG